MDYFDLHSDTPFKHYQNRLRNTTDKISIPFEEAALFDNWHQTFAIWIDDAATKPFELYQNILADFNKKLESKPSNLTPVLAVEGGAVLENDIERTEILKNDKIKFLTLTWNGENNIAGGSKTEKGLTDFGKKVIKRLNRYRIACDLSHINEKSFYSAIEISDFPIATHSNCFSICPHKRNLKDEQIKLIAEKGGVVGINFYPVFLGDNVFENIYQNIFHICDMGYENIIAIGSDFDGADMHESLDSISKIPSLYHFLSTKGFNKELLNKIFFENAEKFVAKL